MTIKEILKIVCLLSGRDVVKNYLETGGDANAETLETVNKLTALANLVINELSSTYIPMVKTEKVNVSGGKVKYTELSERALEIKAVYCENGIEEGFKCAAEFFTTSNGSKYVEYEYLPSNYGLDDEIGYTERDVPTRVLAYGVLAEFAICENRYDEAVSHHKRYVDGVAQICMPKNAVIKKRSFV